MKKVAAFALGFSFLISGFLISDAQALPALSQIKNQFSADRDRIVTLVHRPAHNDCKKDKKGRSHYHAGMNDRRINCPGGRK
jgi:hypothetical protein